MADLGVTPGGSSRRARFASASLRIIDSDRSDCRGQLERDPVGRALTARETEAPSGAQTLADAPEQEHERHVARVARPATPTARATLPPGGAPRGARDRRPACDSIWFLAHCRASMAEHESEHGAGAPGARRPREACRSGRAAGSGRGPTHTRTPSSSAGSNRETRTCSIGTPVVLVEPPQRFGRAPRPRCGEKRLNIGSRITADEASASYARDRPRRQPRTAMSPLEDTGEQRRTTDRLDARTTSRSPSIAPGHSCGLTSAWPERSDYRDARYPRLTGTVIGCGTVQPSGHDRSVDAPSRSTTAPTRCMARRTSDNERAGEQVSGRRSARPAEPSPKARSSPTCITGARRAFAYRTTPRWLT